MPVSLRLNKELEDKVNQIAKKLNINKTEVIKRSLKKYPNRFLVGPTGKLIQLKPVEEEPTEMAPVESTSPAYTFFQATGFTRKHRP